MSSLPTYKLTVNISVQDSTNLLVGNSWSLKEDSTMIVTSDDSSIEPYPGQVAMQNVQYIVTEGSGNTHYGVDFFNAIHNKPELTLQTVRPLADSWTNLGITWKLERKEAGASDDTYETLLLSNGPSGDSQFLTETFSTAWTAPPPETHTYTVTVEEKTANNPRFGQGSDYAYYLNGVEAPTIHFNVGDTYVFDQTDSSNDNHPIQFRTIEDKFASNGLLDTQTGDNQVIWTHDGIWTNETVSGYIEWSVGSSRTLTITPRYSTTTYYACTNHNYMGGAMLDIASNPSPTDLPVITLSTASVSVGVNTVYSDVGVSATDSNNNDISLHIVVSGTVDTSTVGDYGLTYNVADFYGNNAVQATRTVSVVDEINPVITLNLVNGNADMTINVGDTYNEPGAVATDNYDDNAVLTSQIQINGVVDNSTPGDYQITYSVSDSSGNSVQVTRTVSVVDNVPPVITLDGSSEIEIIKDSIESYTDAGAFATDNVDGDISDDVVVSGDVVDTSTVGVYTIRYNVSDAAGNAATEVIRTVTVVAPPADDGGNGGAQSDPYVTPML